ncbi:MAG: hypothetical protein ACHBNF_12170 [Chromatiales bacterium]
MNPHETAQTLTPDHLARKAMVYLRQSSLQQVKQNLESQRLQYALADKAKALGCHRVDIIDCDLGVSAAPGAQVREGFKQLLASVALGDVGGGARRSRALDRAFALRSVWSQAGDFPTGGHYCSGFGGATVDKRVSDEILNALSPLGVAASLAAIEQRNAKSSDRRDALTRQLQQLDYEAPCV